MKIEGNVDEGKLILPYQRKNYQRNLKIKLINRNKNLTIDMRYNSGDDVNLPRG